GELDVFPGALIFRALPFLAGLEALVGLEHNLLAFGQRRGVGAGTGRDGGSDFDHALSSAHPYAAALGWRSTRYLRQPHPRRGSAFHRLALRQTQRTLPFAPGHHDGIAAIRTAAQTLGLLQVFLGLDLDATGDEFPTWGRQVGEDLRIGRQRNW